MALNRVIAEVSFDLERSLYGKGIEGGAHGPHVFVSGLARAGTTILMRLLHATGSFASLTYREMPFVLAPNLWRALSRRSQKAAVGQERAHGDGLDHDFDSPEALEEVFWRVFSGGAYLREDRLVPMCAQAETLERFRVYVALVLRYSGRGRYLSKNNNNILRLGSIAGAFPDAAILVPFRGPLSHANSLFQQHRNFLEINSLDPFSVKYMRWLAHHEFGADHRPFDFPREGPIRADPIGLEYWVELWISVYRSLLDNLPPQAILISYERLCTERESLWPALCGRLGVEGRRGDDSLRPPRMFREGLGNPGLEARASELHDRLLERSFKG